MLALIPVIASSLVLCFILTPFFRDFFGFLGVVDRPDSYRKAHGRIVPRVGGIALAVSYLVAFGALAMGWWRGLFSPEDPSIGLMIRLLPAVAVIFVTGLVDDIRGLSPLKKLLWQILAATYAVYAGVHLAIPPGYPPVFIYMMSIFWLVLCANAFNLIDGLDGLATGVALIAAASLLFAALIHHNIGLALVITPLIGALFGFLYYNFNPASIFLGDCGSLLVGFLLGCYGLMWNQHATTGLGMAAPLVALAFPLFEVMLSVVRRFLRHRPVFSSDRNHIHHRIQSLGLSQRKSALVLYGVSALAAVMAVLQTILRPQPATMLLLISLAVAYMGFRTLKYAEFGVLGQFLFSGELRRTLRSRICMKEYEETLAAATTIEECWIALRNVCRESNFHYVSLKIAGKEFEDTLGQEQKTGGRMHVELPRAGGATFGYDDTHPGSVTLVAPLVEGLQQKFLNAKASWWATPEEVSTLLKTKQASAS